MTIPLFLIPLFAGLVAHALKPVFSRQMRDEQAKTLDPLPRYGGMPSAHMAFVTSLVLVVGLRTGVASVSFAIAVALFILVFDEAVRLRIFVSRYGVAIRRLLQRVPEEEKSGLPPIEQRMGHTVPEVLCGIVVGAGATLAIFLLETVLLQGALGPLTR